MAQLTATEISLRAANAAKQHGCNQAEQKMAADYAKTLIEESATTSANAIEMGRKMGIRTKNLGLFRAPENPTTSQKNP